MRGASLSLVAFAAGCSFQHGTLPSPGDDAGGIDGPNPPIDARPIDAFVVPLPDAQQCWSVAGVGVTVCLTGPLQGNLTLGANTTVDTSMTGTGDFECRQLAIATASSDVCVIAGQTLTIDAGHTLSAQGPKPLVLIANTITLNGTIDVASHVRGRQGPASDLAGCDNGQNSSNAGGGQGGSFGGKGGDGGNQDGQASSGGKPGNALTTVTTLRGGCPGGHGGNTTFSLGHGGGAVLLIAGTLVIGSSGVINASGAAAEKGTAGREGGGGGGSGGMIALSSPMITLDPSGQIYANGGHGGGGSSNNTDGTDGTDPNSPTSGGGGGVGGGSAGDGGTGYPASSSSRNGQNGTNNSDAGGGGGGGAGIIRVYSSVLTSTNISPPPS